MWMKQEREQQQKIRINRTKERIMFEIRYAQVVNNKTA